MIAHCAPGGLAGAGSAKRILPAAPFSEGGDATGDGFGSSQLHRQLRLDYSEHPLGHSANPQVHLSTA